MLNGAYAFHGSFTPLGEYRFVSAAFAGKELPAGVEGNRFRQTLLGRLPVPLPADFVRGIDLQKQGFDNNGKPSYLRGEFRERGWWYYYLYALGVKAPLGTLCLATLACALRVRDRRGVNAGDISLLIPLFVLLAVVSSETGVSRHLRYLLPALPFAFVWISEVAHLANKRMLCGGLIAAFFSWAMVSSLFVYPHSLSYFNKLAGGPLGGRHHLLGSNLDWSQDLLLLRAWIDKHPEAAPMKVAYYGPVSPSLAGIEFELPAREVQAGWFAVSVNIVCGCPTFVADGNGKGQFLPQNALTYFQQFEPIDHAGYSIDIYHISPDQVEQLGNASNFGR